MEFIEYESLDEHARVAVILCQHTDHVNIINEANEPVGVMLSIERYEDIKARIER